MPCRFEIMDTDEADRTKALADMEQLTKHEAMEFLETQPVAHLGTVLDDAPYVTPMSFVVDDGRILLRTMGGRKIDAIRSNPKVCIEVSDYDDNTGAWTSVIINGKAHTVDDAVARQKVVALLYAKYGKVMGSPLSGSGGLMPLGTVFVIEVPIVDITGMCSGRGMRVRTKPGRM